MNTPTATELTHWGRAWRLSVTLFVGIGCMAVAGVVAPIGFWLFMGIVGSLLGMAVIGMSTIPLLSRGYGYKRRPYPRDLAARLVAALVPFAMICGFGAMDWCLARQFNEEAWGFDTSWFGVAAAFAAPLFAGAVWGAITHRSQGAWADADRSSMAT